MVIAWRGSSRAALAPQLTQRPHAPHPYAQHPYTQYSITQHPGADEGPTAPKRSPPPAVTCSSLVGTGGHLVAPRGGACGGNPPVPALGDAPPSAAPPSLPLETHPYAGCSCHPPCSSSISSSISSSCSCSFSSCVTSGASSHLVLGASHGTRRPLHRSLGTPVDTLRTTLHETPGASSGDPHDTLGTSNKSCETSPHTPLRTTSLEASGASHRGKTTTGATLPGYFEPSHSHGGFRKARASDHVGSTGYAGPNGEDTGGGGGRRGGGGSVGVGVGGGESIQGYDEKGSSDADDAELGAFWEVLDTEISPIMPNTGNQESQRIFNEHKEMAKKYLVVQEEIWSLRQKKKELADKLSQLEKKEQLDNQRYEDKLRQLENKRELLKSTHCRLRQQLERIRAQQNLQDGDVLGGENAHSLTPL